MSELTFSILQSIVAICMILIMRYVLPYLKYKLTNMMDETIYEAIVREVKSVEQDARFVLGGDKKNEVLNRVTDWTSKHGLNISTEQLSQLIETAVYVMKNEG